MIAIEDLKGYNCVIYRARRDLYEKNIDHVWYEFAKEKKLGADVVLYFSMSHITHYMSFDVIRGLSMLFHLKDLNPSNCSERTLTSKLL